MLRGQVERKGGKDRLMRKAGDLGVDSMVCKVRQAQVQTWAGIY